ncbi:MAG: PspA/IM30 family protein [Flavobacteriales bacterium]|nr:PspA/IM30 family protein [Flavobacteriales bacterium]
MNIFKRLFNIGRAEANNALDKLEDPIKMTELGIEDLKADLEKAVAALAQVKAQSIRARNAKDNYINKADDYEQKAIQLLKQAQKGELDAAKADELATEAIIRKETNLKNAGLERENQEKLEGSVAQLEAQVKKLKAMISKYENELKTLKARVKVADATKNINKQMAEIDSNSTVSMLERMKEKVLQEEALAESYSELANENTTIDEEIDKALEDIDKKNAQTHLEELKLKLKNIDQKDVD